MILILALASLALLGIPFIPIADRLNPTIWPWRELVKTRLWGIPLVAIAYPLYVILCMALSLDALRRPLVSKRLMGDVARRRARPWLVAASSLLMVVGVVAAIALLWTITNTRHAGYYILDDRALDVIGWFDLILAGIIAVVVLLLGQAMTAYELFTGKALPRQGLARQWRWAISLAAGYGLILGLYCVIRFPDQLMLGLGVALAITMAMAVASSIGTIVPMTLERMHVDPAVATNPIVTTLMDNMGVVIYFTITTTLLALL